MFKILCVDDEIEIREFICEILTDAGYDVASAGDGQEGLELILSYAPDLVISDLSMPIMNGLEILRIVREEHPRFADVPFILFTGRTDKDAVIEGLASGADDYLTKPVDASHLLVKVAASLRQVSRMNEKKQAEQIKLYRALTRSTGDDQRNENDSCEPQDMQEPQESVCLIGREDKSLNDLRVQLEHSGMVVTNFVSGRKFLNSMDDLSPSAALISFFTDDLQGNLVARFAKGQRSVIGYPLILLWPSEAGSVLPRFRNETAIDDFISLPALDITERIKMCKEGTQNVPVEPKASSHA